MNFSQLQDRLRGELQRRIRHGRLSVSLLSRQTGLGQPHLSNFLHGRRGLSLESLDRILQSQFLEVSDLLPARREPVGLMTDEESEEQEDLVRIPLVAHGVAAGEPQLRASSILAMLPFAGELLRGLEPRCSKMRSGWVRFVAIKAGAEDAWGMEPVIQPEAYVVLDRHYTAFRPFRPGEANLYGAIAGTKLVLRYAQFEAERVVLRGHSAWMKADVLEPEPGKSGSDLLVGRVVLVANRWG